MSCVMERAPFSLRLTSAARSWRRASLAQAVLAAVLAVSVVIGCRSGLDNSPARLATVAAEVQALARQPKYADVEITDVSIGEQYVSINLADQAPDFVTDVLRRYGMVVAFSVER